MEETQVTVMGDLHLRQALKGRHISAMGKAHREGVINFQKALKGRYTGQMHVAIYKTPNKVIKA